MSRRIIRSDPGDEQAHLFAPASVEPTKCTCGTTRKNLCAFDADLEHQRISRYANRPRTCLNAWNPRTAPIPY